MKNNYGSYVKSLRLEKKYSQDEVAEKISISRSSYISIEKGTKHLSLDEAKKIANIFNITVNDLMNCDKSGEEKFKEMIFLFLKKAKESGHQIKKTKLAKLLYFTDFTKYFYKDESISNFEYRKIQFGPVPEEYFRIIQELEDDSMIEIEQRQWEDDSDKTSYIITNTIVSSSREIKLLEKYDQKLISQIWDKWKNARSKEIVNYTHQQFPYKDTKSGHVISYDLIKRETEKTVF